MKITLSEKAKEDLTFMMEELKTNYPHTRVRPFALASWIISRYKEVLYPKEEGKIAEQFFNPKASLRTLMQHSQAEELLEGLEKTLQRLKKQAGKKKQRKELDQSD